MKKSKKIAMALLTLVVGATPLALTGCSGGGDKPSTPDNPGNNPNPPIVQPMPTTNVTFNSSNTARGTVSKSGIDNVAYGTKLTVNGNTMTIGAETITAIPESGCEFVEWQMNGSAIPDWYTVYGEPITITAVFRGEAFAVELVDNNDPTNKIYLYTGQIETGTTVAEFKSIVSRNCFCLIDTVYVNAAEKPDDYVIQKGDVLEVTDYSIVVRIYNDMGSSYGNYLGSFTTQDGSSLESVETYKPLKTEIEVDGNTLNINGEVITAVPNSGYHFIQWNIYDGIRKDLAGRTKQFPIEIYVYFEINTYQVTIKDNLDHVVDSGVIRHGVTFGETSWWSNYNIITAELADGTVVDDNTPITGDTTIYITYAKDVTLGVVDGDDQASENGTLSTSTVTIKTGDTLTVSGNTLTVGDTTITVDYDADYHQLIEWRLGNTKITDSIVYDGTETTISVVVVNVMHTVTVDLTTIENDTVRGNIANKLGLSTITEYVAAGTTLQQLSDSLLKYGLTLASVKLNDSDNAISVNADNTIMSDTEIHVISCVFMDLLLVDSDDVTGGINGFNSAFSTDDLKAIYIPALASNKTNIIHNGAFEDSNLETIIFGGPVKIKAGAFSGCNIKNIYVNSLEDWLNMDIQGAVFEEINLYINNELVTDIEITGGTAIANYAFAGIKNIQNVTVGGNIASVGESAFQGCTGLKTITFATTASVNVANNAFKGCTKLTTITVNALGTIGEYAFYECTKLTGALAINGNIGNNAFYECLNLTSVTLANSITEIGGGAFYLCKNLETINLPTSLTTLGACAFWECKKITNIVLPNSLKVLNIFIFKDCIGLVNVTLPSGLESINEDCFAGCSSLESITIPESVTYIARNAFSESGLNSVEFEKIEGWINDDMDDAGFSDDKANNAVLLKEEYREFYNLSL